MLRSIKIVLMTVVTCVSIGCEHEPIERAFEAGGFFPRTAGSKWKYEYTMTCDWPVKGERCAGTTFAAAGPDLYGDGNNLFQDSIYAPMYSPTTQMQFVKVIGHEYFAVGYYLSEYKFLDDGLKVNDTWSMQQFANRSNEFRVTEVDATKAIRGKTYPHVIVITETVIDSAIDPQYRQERVTVHYYAYGVGEIYSKWTFQTATTFETSEYELVEYYIAP